MYVRQKPTRRALLDLKERKELAVRAHRLLEQKHSLLREELVSIEGMLLPLREKMRSDLSKAYFSLEEASERIGTRSIVLAAYSTTPDSEVELRGKSSHGLYVPELISSIQKRDVLDRGYSLYSTSPSVDLTARLFKEALSSLLMIAELEGIKAVHESEIQKTRIKVEALERILIPRIDEAIDRIQNRLDENERQGHFIIRRIRDRQRV
ncbi:MAG: V-type ATP synthase subunit D [Candidatus Bathyarchaeota archaeon]|nr:MAG: V-type ATP synthase subunit D [Candidatus Bathyarchaeota archaeon]